MAWFKKKDRVIDLSEHYRRQQEKAAEIKADVESSSTTSSQETNAGGMFGIFGGSTPTPSSETSNSGGYVDVSASPNSGGEERKRKLAKRLMEMTEKLEDINNQIYHLQQRVELLEKKSGF